MNQTTNRRHEIYCKGRFSSSGITPCMRNFSHIGKWSDVELVEHQKWEEVQDTDKDHWIGFEIGSKFELLQEKGVDITNDQ